MKFYEVMWFEGLAGPIRQFSTTLSGVKAIKEKAKKLNDWPKDCDAKEFQVVKHNFKNTDRLISWLNVRARNNDCCGDE